MLVSHSSPHFHHPVPCPFPIPLYASPAHEAHYRAMTTPSIAHLTSTFNHKQPVQTGPPPLSRSSSIRQAAQDPASDDDKHRSEEDELEGDAGDDEEDADDFLAHQTKSTATGTPNKRKGKTGNETTSPRSGGDKRRRTRASLNGSAPGSARSPPSAGQAVLSASTSARDRPPPIKPVGFAAGRESRRQSDGHHNIPSPVVMGFDYKMIDADQLKTVRETISIREQQQALIAQRRREALEGNPSDSAGRELTFKPWQNPEQDRKEKSVPSRAQQSRDPGSLLTVNTAHSDKDIVLASRSAPMGQSLAAQQASREREPFATGRPPNMLPPIHTRNGHMPQSSDLRTAPIDRTAETVDRPHFFRPSNGRYEVPQTARPVMSDRRSVTVHAGPLTGVGERLPIHGQNGQERPVEPTSPPRSGPYQNGSAARREFLAPFERMYDLLSQTESLKYALQDMHHRYESALSAKNKEIGDFKNTAHAASTLLNNLQQSADSLKDMVRYEISRAPPPSSASFAGRSGLSADERQEFEDMKLTLRKLEEAAASKKDGDGSERPAKRRKSKGANADED